jgi:hypothetical protein
MLINLRGNLGKSSVVNFKRFRGWGFDTTTFASAVLGLLPRPTVFSHTGRGAVPSEWTRRACGAHAAKYGGARPGNGVFWCFFGHKKSSSPRK